MIKSYNKNIISSITYNFLHCIKFIKHTKYQKFIPVSSLYSRKNFDYKGLLLLLLSRLVVSDSSWPHGLQPTRLLCPWDFPGKSTVVGCHCLLCYKGLLLLLLSRFSRVRLCATPQTVAHQAPLSLGCSRQEHWSGLPFLSPMHESEKWKWSRSVMSDSSRPHGLQPTRLLQPWDFPGKSTGVGCHCLLHYKGLLHGKYIFSDPSK